MTTAIENLLNEWDNQETDTEVDLKVAEKIMEEEAKTVQEFKAADKPKYDGSLFDVQLLSKFAVDQWEVAIFLGTVNDKNYPQRMSFSLWCKPVSHFLFSNFNLNCNNYLFVKIALVKNWDTIDREKLLFEIMREYTNAEYRELQEPRVMSDIFRLAMAGYNRGAEQMKKTMESAALEQIQETQAKTRQAFKAGTKV